MFFFVLEAENDNYIYIFALFFLKKVNGICFCDKSSIK